MKCSVVSYSELSKNALAISSISCEEKNVPFHTVMISIHQTDKFQAKVFRKEMFLLNVSIYVTTKPQRGIVAVFTKINKVKECRKKKWAHKAFFFFIGYLKI